MSTDSSIRKLTFRAQPADKNRENYSISVNDLIYSLFDKAIQAEFSNLPDATVLITPSKIADYQCNSAMSISSV
jgi:hypothetical protein